jgi:hypothetical protein
MPTLTRRVIERVPSDKSWIAKRPNRPAISMRITTAANVNNATAQDAQVIEVRPALLPRSNSKQRAIFTTSKRLRRCAIDP